VCIVHPKWNKTYKNETSEIYWTELSTTLYVFTCIQMWSKNYTWHKLCRVFLTMLALDNLCIVCVGQEKAMYVLFSCIYSVIIRPLNNEIKEKNIQILIQKYVQDDKEKFIYIYIYNCSFYSWMKTYQNCNNKKLKQ